MDAHHRKIDLQSASDLTYLRSNIEASAREKIDTAIPRQAAAAGEDVAYRKRVEELVHKYVDETIRLALPSLTINGFEAPTDALRSTNACNTSGNPDTQPTDADISNGNYESYDPRLAQKLRELYQQLESESTKVAELRREAPGAAARQYMERIEVELEQERALNTEKIDQMSSESENAANGVLHFETLKRREEIENIWGKGVKGLVDLGKVPGVLAKAERAGKAIAVVEAL